ncbi:hypothetical protein EHI96_19165 [Cronobacter malonaticus]|uniref:CDI toxin immunity protein n=1 Tax=Cronobacter malonaticus TaxID=413503 RepID=UPI0013758EAF|nr:hypothetical protein [Cronobacter malonaticus]NCI01942.1 hypothetical protein [Cronobacter malonaticus]
MTLFEECAEVLKSNFTIVTGKVEKMAIKTLYEHGAINGYINWGVKNYTVYNDFQDLLKSGIVKDDKVFIFADDVDVPIFETTLSLIAANADDVFALCPKIYIYNNDFLLQPMYAYGEIHFF